MITETEIIDIMSGSMMSDFPPVVDNNDIPEYTKQLFLSILSVDSNNKTPNHLFHISNNSDKINVAQYYIRLIEEAQQQLDRQIQSVDTTILNTSINDELPNTRINTPIVFSKFLKG